MVEKKIQTHKCGYTFIELLRFTKSLGVGLLDRALEMLLCVILINLCTQMYTPAQKFGVTHKM